MDYELPILPPIAALLLSACAAAPSSLPSPSTEAPSTEAVVWIPHPGPVAAAASARDLDSGPHRSAPPRREGRQPNRFWVMFLDDGAERRDWVRVKPQIWEERSPNGAVTRFHIIGRINDGSRAGVIIRRVPDGGMEVFIPDLGTDAFAQFRVSPEGDWHPLGQMHLIE